MKLQTEIIVSGLIKYPKMQTDFLGGSLFALLLENKLQRVKRPNNFMLTKYLINSEIKYIAIMLIILTSYGVQINKSNII